MRRFAFLFPLLLTAPSGAVAQAAVRPSAPPAPTTTPAAWADHTRVLPEKLRGIPTGLTLTHTPALVYPAPDPTQTGHFRWHHATTVRADVAELELVECGSFIWYSAAGWQANMRETPAEFAELFRCPGGKLRVGQDYTFADNDRFATSAAGLYPGDALWYVLARDARTGQLYKGLGLVETEGDVRGK